MIHRFTRRDGFPRLVDYLLTPFEEQTVLNLGAGKSDTGISELLRYLPFLCITHVDIYEPDLNVLRKVPHVASHVTFLVHDLNKPIPLATNSFSVVMGLDVVEHLESDQAVDLIAEAERIASSRVVFFIPLGFCPSFATDQPNPYQEHLSVWFAENLEYMGYNVDVMENFHDFTTSTFDACWAWKEV